MSGDGLELLERLVSEFAIPGKKHEFVIELVTLLHKHLSSNRRHAVKKFLMTKLKEFSNSSNRDVQLQTFPLWLLLAEYSQTMDIRKVLDNVSHMYQDYLPYYRAYITELQRLGNENEALEMAQKCKDKCKLSDEQFAKEFPFFVQGDDDVTSVVFDATVFQRSPRNQKLTFNEEVTIIGHEEFEKDMHLDDETVSSLTPPRASPATEKPSKKDDSIVLSSAINEVSIKQICQRYKSKNGQTSVLIPSLIGAQLAEQLGKLTDGGRTVRNLNSDTVVIGGNIDSETRPKVQIASPIVKIRQHSADDKENEQQVAMGFLKIAGDLLFLKDFSVVQVDGSNTVDIAIPRRHLDRNVWIEIFGLLLNPKANEKTDWMTIADRLRSTFVKMAETQKYTWQSSLGEFNEILKPDFNESY